MPIPSTASLDLRIASLRSKLDFLLGHKILLLFILGFLFVISVVAICATVYDKWAAKNRPKNRMPEATLLLVSVLGGSAAMLLTMLGIRHKTKHLKFMLGIPLILAAQVAAVAIILFL